MILINRDLLRQNLTLPQTEENKQLMAARPGRLIQPPCGRGRTQYQYKDECDVNKIIQRYNQTGEFYHMRKTEPVYRDMTAIDFEFMNNEIAKMEETFMQLPVEIRARFHYSTQEMLAFLDDDKNRDEAEKIGLIERKKPPETPAVKPPETPAKTE